MIKNKQLFMGNRSFWFLQDITMISNYMILKSGQQRGLKIPTRGEKMQACFWVNKLGPIDDAKHCKIENIKFEKSPPPKKVVKLCMYSNKVSLETLREGDNNSLFAGGLPFSKRAPPLDCNLKMTSTKWNAFKQELLRRQSVQEPSPMRNN